MLSISVRQLSAVLLYTQLNCDDSQSEILDNQNIAKFPKQNTDPQFDSVIYEHPTRSDLNSEIFSSKDQQGGVLELYPFPPNSLTGRAL